MPVRTTGHKLPAPRRRARPQVVPAPAVAPVAIAPAALQLFPAEPEAELAEALALVRDFPMDAWFVKMWTRCTKGCCRRGPSHGPYWRAKWRRDGVVRSKYIGSEARLREIVAAHDRVRAYLLERGIKAQASTPKPRRNRVSRTLNGYQVRQELRRHADAGDDEQQTTLAIPIMEVRAGRR
jgi:hypothetical protein